MKALKSPFNVDLSLHVATTTSYEDIVRGQVIDALMTNRGERVYRPEYGCDIQAALFDPSDELVRSDAANYVKQRLQSLVTRAVVTEVTFESPDTEPGVVYVNVVYRVSSFREGQVVKVELSSEFLRRQINV